MPGTEYRSQDIDLSVLQTRRVLGKQKSWSSSFYVEIKTSSNLDREIKPCPGVYGSSTVKARYIPEALFKVLSILVMSFNIQNNFMRCILLLITVYLRNIQT